MEPESSFTVFTKVIHPLAPELSQINPYRHILFL
jgi:hypothetical protein